MKFYIEICPPRHPRFLYGKCPECHEWFKIRGNGTLRIHKDCTSRSLSKDGPRTEDYALMCSKDRHVYVPVR